MAKQQRQYFWAARVDFNTFDVYIRKRKVRPGTAARYSQAIGPQGDIFGATEDDLLHAVYTLIQDHISKAKQMLKVMAADTIPAVYLKNASDARIVRLADDNGNKLKLA